MDIKELRFSAANSVRDLVLLPSEVLELLDRFGAVEKERDDLKAKIEQMERQEPVAWRTFYGEGGYGFRSYEGNENYKLGWDARNPNHAGWVEPLYVLPGVKGEEK